MLGLVARKLRTVAYLASQEAMPVLRQEARAQEALRAATLRGKWDGCPGYAGARLS